MEKFVIQTLLRHKQSVFMQQVDSVYAFLNNHFEDVCVANGTIEISIYI